MSVVLTPAQAVERWEGHCDPSQGCGVACCHFEGSPCVELDQATKRCRIYADRFGLRRTVAGQTFRCAPMKEFLLHHPAPAHCGYARVRSIQGHSVATDEGVVPLVRGMA